MSENFNEELPKMIYRVLESVENCPAHCHDIANELQIDMRTASAILSSLFSSGLLIRRDRVKPGDTTRSRMCWVYERTKHGRSVG